MQTLNPDELSVIKIHKLLWDILPEWRISDPESQRRNESTKDHGGHFKFAPFDVDIVNRNLNKVHSHAF